MPTLVVGMFRRYLAIHMPTTSVGMPPITPKITRIKNTFYETLRYLASGAFSSGVVAGFSPSAGVAGTGAG
jgi:hypothetical protein